MKSRILLNKSVAWTGQCSQVLYKLVTLSRVSVVHSPVLLAHRASHPLPEHSLLYTLLHRVYITLCLEVKAGCV